MISKRTLLICLIGAVALCVVEAAVILKMKIPETRLTTIKPAPATTEEKPATWPNFVQDEIVGIDVDTESLVPEWSTKYPDLYFFKKTDKVKVIETNEKDIIFALRQLNESGFGTYDFWFVQKNRGPKMLAADIINECDQIEMNRSGGLVYLDFGASPCEGGYSRIKKYFDASTGELRYTFVFHDGDGADTVKLTMDTADKRTIIEAIPVYSGNCNGLPISEYNYETGPQTTFSGVSVSENGGTKKFYPLPGGKRIFCEMVYGGGYDNLGFNNATLIDDKAVFYTFFGVTTQIDVKDNSYRPVIKTTDATWPSDKPNVEVLKQFSAAIRSQIFKSVVPILVPNERSMRDIKLSTHNRQSYFSARIDGYDIQIDQALDRDSIAEVKYSDIRVRNSEVVLFGLEKNYFEGRPSQVAEWKEGNTNYRLRLTCFFDDKSSCKVTEQLKTIFSKIVYVGGSSD